jgi:6-phosphogluconolactonase
MLSAGMNVLRRVIWLVLAVGPVCILAMPENSAAADRSMFVYIGTYTYGASKGIYRSQFDTETGQLSAPELAAETKNPTFLAIHPNGRFLYAANEVESFEGPKAGAVSAFAIDGKTGKLTLLDEKSSGGTGPCHLAVDRKGKCVLVANYGGGSVAALPIESDGSVGAPAAFIQHEGSSVNRRRQSGPHAHFITTDPADRFALVCDLGLDKVLVYRLGTDPVSLATNDPPWTAIKPGSGPRHLAFHPSGRYVYLINELGWTLMAFSYDARRGALTELQTVSTLPDGPVPGDNLDAEVQVHPSGKFLYGSNRGHNSLAVFAIDEKTGLLTYVDRVPTQGKTPRHFAIDPTGRWLLVENQESNDVVVFKIDTKTGRLTPTGQTVEVGAPVCLVFLPEL